MLHYKYKSLLRILLLSFLVCREVICKYAIPQTSFSYTTESTSALGKLHVNPVKDLKSGKTKQFGDFFKVFNSHGKESTIVLSPPVSTVVTISRIPAFIRNNDVLSKFGKEFIKWLRYVVDSSSSIVRSVYEFSHAWMLKHRSAFGFYSKSAFIVFLGIKFLQRLGNWYKGLAEYELLLDTIDHDYQSYGSSLNGIGASLIASMNETSIADSNSMGLYRRLAASLDKPCFPRTMTDYAVHMGRDISLLLEGISKKFPHFDDLLPGRTVIKGRSSFASHHVHRSSSPEDILSDAELARRREQELYVIKNLLRGIAILQARQADAYLRVVRLEVLSAANTCEDLLKFWKNKVATKSQTLRLPLPRFILARLPELGRNIHIQTSVEKFKRVTRGIFSSSTDEASIAMEKSDLPAATTADDESIASPIILSHDKSFRSLNSREKVVHLENILNGLYRTAGKIQSHLNSLDGIRSKNAFVSASESDEAGLTAAKVNYGNHSDDIAKGYNGHALSGPSNITIDSGGRSDTSVEQGWQALAAWVKEASSLTSEALTLVMMRSSRDIGGSSDDNLKASFTLQHRDGQSSVVASSSSLSEGSPTKAVVSSLLDNPPKRGIIHRLVRLPIQALRLLIRLSFFVVGFDDAPASDRSSSDDSLMAAVSARDFVESSVSSVSQPSSQLSSSSLPISSLDSAGSVNAYIGNFSSDVHINTTWHDDLLGKLSSLTYYDVDMSLSQLIAYNSENATSVEAVSEPVISGKPTGYDVREFVLPIRLDRVLELCLLKNDLFSNIVNSSMADKLINVSAWESALSSKSGVDQKPSVWIRSIDCLLACDKMLGGGQLPCQWLQVLNTNPLPNPVSDQHEVANITSGTCSITAPRMTLVAFMNLSHWPFCHGVNYTQRWSFESIPAPSHLTHVDPLLPPQYHTKVSVTVDIEIPSGLIYRPFLARALLHTVRGSVREWSQRAMEVAVEFLELPTAVAGSSSSLAALPPLSRSDQQLLESLPSTYPRFHPSLLDNSASSFASVTAGLSEANASVLAGAFSWEGILQGIKSFGAAVGIRRYSASNDTIDLSASNDTISNKEMSSNSTIDNIRSTSLEIPNAMNETNNTSQLSETGDGLMLLEGKSMNISFVLDGSLSEVLDQCVSQSADAFASQAFVAAAATDTNSGSGSSNYRDISTGVQWRSAPNCNFSDPYEPAMSRSWWRNFVVSFHGLAGLYSNQVGSSTLSGSTGSLSSFHRKKRSVTPAVDSLVRFPASQHLRFVAVNHKSGHNGSNCSQAQSPGVAVVLTHSVNLSSLYPSVAALSIASTDSQTSVAMASAKQQWAARFGDSVNVTIEFTFRSAPPTLMQQRQPSSLLSMWLSASSIFGSSSSDSSSSSSNSNNRWLKSWRTKSPASSDGSLLREEDKSPSSASGESSLFASLVEPTADPAADGLTSVEVNVQFNLPTPSALEAVGWPALVACERIEQLVVSAVQSHLKEWRHRAVALLSDYHHRHHHHTPLQDMAASVMASSSDSGSSPTLQIMETLHTLLSNAGSGFDESEASSPTLTKELPVPAEDPSVSRVVDHLVHEATKARGDVSGELVGEFVVNAPLFDVVDQCVLRAGVFAQTIAAAAPLGSAAISRISPWSPLLLGEQERHQQRVWMRDIYASQRPLSALFRSPRSKPLTNRHLNLLVVRYPNNVVVDEVTKHSDSDTTTAASANATAASTDVESEAGVVHHMVFTDLSLVPFYHGVNCTQHWTFENLPTSAAAASSTPSRTKVTLRVLTGVPSSVYQSFQQSLLVQDLKANFLAHWQVFTEEAMSKARSQSGASNSIADGGDVLDAIKSFLQHGSSHRATTPTDLSTSSGSSRDHHLTPYHSSSPIGSSHFPHPSVNPELSQRQRLLLLRQRIDDLRQQQGKGLLLLQTIPKVSTAFAEYLDDYGIRSGTPFKLGQSQKFLRRLTKLGFWVRFSFLSGLAYATAEASKRPEDFARARDTIISNAKYFIDRRLVTPTKTILNDMILNKRVSITDKEALKDAQKSLSNMLYDFLVQYKPKISEPEKRRISKSMDMSHISEEYEIELRRPMQNIVSGRIARLVLIQIQFVKKELLVAMQAIDELFNANQVNLQLLAVTPAIMSVFVLQLLTKMLVSAVRSASKGKFIESIGAVHRDIRVGMRDLERMLCMSPSFGIGTSGSSRASALGTTEIPAGSPALWASASGNPAGITRTGFSSSPGASHLPLDSDNDGLNFSSAESLLLAASSSRDSDHSSSSSGVTSVETGKMMSILYRLHSLLVVNSSQFDHDILRQLQEDLRDLTCPFLSVAQRLALVERIIRSYPFLQTNRKVWAGGLIA